MALNAYSIAGLAYNAGWRGPDWPNAVAVALAESSGDPNAHNTARGNDARGLWQVNVKEGAHPGYKGRDLYNPNVNAQTAHEIWERDGWAPWKSSRGGQKLRWPEAMAGVAAYQVRHPGSAVGQAVAPETVMPNLPGPVPGFGGEPEDRTDTKGLIAAVRDLIDATGRGVKWVTTPANVGRIVLVILGAGLVMGTVQELSARAFPEATKNARALAGAASKIK